MVNDSFYRILSLRMLNDGQLVVHFLINTLWFMALHCGGWWSRRGLRCEHKTAFFVLLRVSKMSRRPSAEGTEAAGEWLKVKLGGWSGKVC